jgi:predicted RND superfamily exporter protein
MREPTSIARWFIDVWYSKRVAIAILGAATLIAVAVLSPKPTYQISLEGLFPKNAPIIRSQQRARAVFGDNRFVLMAYHDSQLLTESGIQRTAKIEQKIRGVSGVRDCLSLATLDRQLRLLGTSIGDDSRMAQSYRAMFRGFTHDEHYRIAGFICLLAPRVDLQQEVEVIADLRAILATPPTAVAGSGGADLSGADLSDGELSDGDLHSERLKNVAPGDDSGIVVGEPVLIADAFTSIQRDSWRLQAASTLLLAIVVAICLRSLRWVVVVFGTVQLSIWVTTGVASLLHLRWSLLSSMFPAIIVVIGAGALTHLAVWSRRLFDDPSQTRSAECAVLEAIRRLAIPIIATCVTDAVGFLALWVSPIVPLREFALVVSLGILVFLITASLLVPALACWALGRQRPSVPSPEVSVSDLRRFQQRTRWGLIAFTVVVLAASSGISRLQLETDITRSFREQSDLARSFRFVDEHMGGAGIWEVHVPVAGEVTDKLVAQVQALSVDLKKIRITVGDGIGSNQDTATSALSNVVSLADVLATADQSKLSRFARVPMFLRLKGVQAAMPVFFNTLYGETAEGEKYLRVLLRSPDGKSVQWKRQVIDAVEETTRRHFPLGGGNADGNTGGNASDREGDEDEIPYVAGTFVVIAGMVERLVQDQWRTVGVSLGCVFVVLAIFLRGPLLAGLALLPSVMSIAAILGLIGWCGIRVDLGVVMIAAVSLGLAVDGAIHMIHCIRLEQSEQAADPFAILRGVRATGGPLVFATMAVVIGFSTLAISDFRPSVTFGLLVGVATTAGLLGNLTIVPIGLSMLSGVGVARSEKS